MLYSIGPSRLEPPWFRPSRTIMAGDWDGLSTRLGTIGKSGSRWRTPREVLVKKSKSRSLGGRSLLDDEIYKAKDFIKSVGEVAGGRGPVRLAGLRQDRLVDCARSAHFAQDDKLKGSWRRD